MSKDLHEYLELAESYGAKISFDEDLIIFFIEFKDKLLERFHLDEYHNMLETSLTKLNIPQEHLLDIYLSMEHSEESILIKQYLLNWRLSTRLSSVKLHSAMQSRDTVVETQLTLTDSCKVLDRLKSLESRLMIIESRINRILSTVYLAD